MPVLDARELRKSLGARTLLDGVSLTLEEGERVGLVGPNGCGKSTLARILAGIDPADGGELARQRGARVLYLAQEPTFEGDPTALDAVLSGLGDWQAARAKHDRASEALARGEDHDRWLAEMESAAHDIERLGGWDRDHEARSYLSHLGVTRLDAKVATMSGGERRRVALARLLVASPELAILDEPTNHLDVETIEWLERHLASSFRGAVLLVTHDRWFLNQVVARTLELERGKLHSYEGGWEEYLEAKAERGALERRAEANRQNLLRRELEWLRRTPAARTGKQKARINRAESTIANAPPPRERQVELSMDATRTGRTVLELHDVSLAIGGRTLVEKLDLSLTKGERIGIVGPNGAGKSTLLRAILGELEPIAGRVVRGANTKISYLDQHRSGLDLEKSVADNVSPHSRQVDWGGRRVELVSYLERMLFDADQQRQPVGALSGGERARVLLARMLLESANLLILDEPTNDLDAPTLAALEEMLSEFDGTALVVTHDRWFLERVATAILAFEGDGRVRRWAGSYSTWRALRAQEDARLAEERADAEAAAKKTAAPARAAAPAAKKKGLSGAEKRELEGIFEKIEAREAEVARMEAELADASVYATRGAEVPAMLAALEAAKAEVATMMARWEELEARKDA
ncbi:ABC-F family ATP-binding cassette domain-containing protein [Sandaracinus amylolyticus]|uniref:ATPase component of ABC transporter n=1 Tax=Sandaracinus amylolyticus TaxID=927083 RepID=A0A0F6YI99_9BACT|nr:ABC-F family ATP-binding cassette domain-containing protein [Sandaracinus amylolyticus]AKF05935.1 ATPase component of ABC transporter [Sandaracinus amylolyticus]